MDALAQAILVCGLVLFVLISLWCLVLIVAECCYRAVHVRPPSPPPRPERPAPVWYSVVLPDGTEFYCNSPICLRPSCPATAHSEFVEVELHGPTPKPEPPVLIPGAPPA